MTMRLMPRVLLAFGVLVPLLLAPLVHAQGVPGVDPNKCLAGKNKCVSKKIKGLMKCREKCQKKPDKCGAVQAACEQKVKSKFDGGTSPAKGCFAKLEAKADPMKPESVCTTTGDTASMEAEIDAEVASLLGRLEGAPAPTCGDGVVNVAGEQCDGADLNGATCASLGHYGGSLGCDGSCLFDASGCGADCIGVGGVELGGACWFFGADGDSCDATCATVGLAYDDATRTYAGSSGTLANCYAVLGALGVFGDVDQGDASCGVATGCSFLLDSIRVRCTSPPTDSSASLGGVERACACS